MSRVKIAFLVFAGILIIMQLIPLNQTNPPVVQNVAAPVLISEILKTSCYDCHSNETIWPWYSRIAPGSFLITRDVKMGRQHLNFSEFSDLDSFDSTDIADDLIEVLEAGDMPVIQYLLLHPSASLRDSESQALLQWVETLYPE